MWTILVIFGIYRIYVAKFRPRTCTEMDRFPLEQVFRCAETSVHHLSRFLAAPGDSGRLRSAEDDRAVVHHSWSEASGCGQILRSLIQQGAVKLDEIGFFKFASQGLLCEKKWATQFQSNCCWCCLFALCYGIFIRNQIKPAFFPPQDCRVTVRD